MHNKKGEIKKHFKKNNLQVYKTRVTRDVTID